MPVRSALRRHAHGGPTKLIAFPRPGPASRHIATGSGAFSDTPRQEDAMPKKTTRKKARNPAQQSPMVALYGLDEKTERGDAARAVMRELGIHVRTIEIRNLNDPAGSIVGMAGIKPSAKPFEGEPPQDEFMLVGNLTSAQLNQMLASMRQADVSIAHKAQITPHNRLWPISMLMKEIAKEHAAMTKLGE